MSDPRPTEPARTPPERDPRGDRGLFERVVRDGDPRAREQLIERYLPLARSVALRYQRSYEPVDDLVQIAALGLIKAIDRFDPSRGIAFSSYAVPTILGEVKRHFRDRTWSVRVPRELQERSLRVDRAAAELTETLGRQPSVAEMSELLRLDEEAVLEALQAGGAHSALSLEATRHTGDDVAATLAESIGDEDDGFERADARATVDVLLAVLSEREQDVLRMRFEEDLTQAEIGAVVGVSQMQVSRITRRALARLHTIALGVRAPQPLAGVD